jgi:ADP-ribosyl-[dinitrogen reductase] hydrolase
MNSNEFYKGILVASCLGDALGAPFEFKGNKNTYNGSLNTIVDRHARFGRITLDKGQLTDDSEMKFAILKIKNINADSLAISYMEWANSPNCFSMGRNTRNLFKGVTTLKGYKVRYAKMLEENPNNQSNGALMRCAALIIYRDRQLYIEDCKLTNPHKNCIDSNLFYMYMLESILDGQKIEYKCENPEIQAIINKALNNETVDVTVNKGWCLHAIYLSVFCLMHFETFTEAITYVINRAGDTDTNAAIVGALFGAKLGYDKLYEEQSENIEILINCDTSGGNKPRPVEYQLKKYIQISNIN